ncbi:hypothetical protein HYDPIDRAFT_38666 [Hydnomerulius pinastri MD-312]|nr:hypothetical protein HYDPIDRAFT_38666 [Hydnomerulius pinastri MD-312]
MRPTFRSTRTDRRATAPKCKENIDTQGASVSDKAKLHEHTQRNTSSRKARHRMSIAQLTRLEEVFKQDTHPSRQRKKDVAGELGMDYKTVTIWFQNKRQTSKRTQPAKTQEVPTPLRRKDLRALNCTPDRATTDSCLRSVSSPCHNTTLETPEPESNLKKPVSQIVGRVNVVASKAIIKIKPQFPSFNVLRSKVKEGPELEDAKITVGDIRDLERGHPSPITSDKSATPIAARNERPGEKEQSKDQVVHRKRIRTLEWACERHAKRRRSSKDKLASDDEEGSTSVSDKQRNDSALSLLSLASSTRQGPPKDVMRGASLLLSFKHSLRREQSA